MDYNLYSTEQLLYWKDESLNEEDYEDVEALDKILREREDGKIPKKVFSTHFKAICVTENTLLTYVGPKIVAYSHEEAQEFCNENFPYLNIVGQLVAEVPTDEDGSPLFDERIEYVE